MKIKKKNKITKNSENFDSLDLKKKVMIYVENWKYFLISTIIIFSLAVVFLKSTQKIYQTTAKIKILDNSKELNISFDALTLMGKSQINLENEIEVLKSYRLLKSVIEELNLETNYVINSNISSNETNSNPFIITTTLDDNNLKSPLNYLIKITSNGYIITNKIDNSIVKINSLSYSSIKANLPISIQPREGYVLNDYIGNEYNVIIDSKLNTLKKLTDNLQIENLGKESEILSISITNANKEKSEKIINKIIEQFNDDGIQDRQLVSQRTIDFVNERFNYLSKELENIEENKKDYKKENKLSVIEFDVENSLQNKSISQSELYKSETQLELAKFIKEALSKNNANLIPADIGIDNEEINNAINEYNKLVLEKQRLSTSGGKKNPAIQVLNNDLEENKKNIERTIENYNTKLRIELTKFKKVNSNFNSQFAKLPEQEKRLRSIERQQKIKESLYLLLLQKREEAAINLAIINPSVKVVDFAITNQSPVFPKASIIYSIAFLLSIFIPFLIINISNLLNTTINSKSDLDEYLPSIPIVGEIPFLKEVNLGIKSSQTSILSNVFNLVCANINYILPLDKKSQGKVIYITSSIKNEGKTFSSINIAFSYANLGKKVLLIGADLRNPQIEKYLNLKKNPKGLSDYLHLSEMKWQDVISKSSFYPDNLDLLTTGTIPPNPANLLVNGKFKSLIEDAKTVYDYVIVDTAPTLFVSDTKLILNHADALIILCRINHTDKELLRHIEDTVSKFKSNNVAVLLNHSLSKFNKKYNYGNEYDKNS